MLQVSYFYNGSRLQTRPNTSSLYLTIIHFEPAQDRVISELNTIPFLNDIIELVKSKKTILVIYAGDEGYYLETCPVQNFKDTTVETLNEWGIENGFDKNYFHFICHNLLIKEVMERKNYNMIGWGGVYESENYLNIDFLNPDILNYKSVEIEKLFLTYNRSSRIHRFYLLFKLLESSLIEKSIYSYNKHNHNEPEMEELVNDYNLDKDVFERFKKLERNVIGEDIIPTEMDYGQVIMANDHLKTFLSVVTETEVGQDTVYLSEKTFKPIFCMHPFISVSSPNTLRELKKLGYKTFDKWWDESYDECDNYIDRINKIIDILNELSKKSIPELNSIKIDMYDVLKHNRDTYYKRLEQDFLLETLNKVEKYLYN